MTGFDVRPFRRADREQVTLLVNRHAAAVVPDVSASVATALNQFEREPDEFVVGSWVDERRCLVAEQDGSVVAAAPLARYRDDPAVGPAFRGAGEIKWLLFWHVAHLYARLGFTAPADAVEVVHLADLTGVPAPLPGLRVVRTVGINGTRFSAHLGSERVGLLEVEVLDPAETPSAR